MSQSTDPGRQFCAKAPTASKLSGTLKKTSRRKYMRCGAPQRKYRRFPNRPLSAKRLTSIRGGKLSLEAKDGVAADCSRDAHINFGCLREVLLTGGAGWRGDRRQ